MGNKQTLPSDEPSSGVEPGWLMVDSSPEDSISFDPQNSYAVCAGVGEQADLTEKKTNLGAAADRDAIGVARLFHKKFQIPDDQIILLTSRTKPASDKSIISALRRQARNVGDDGILVFQFSGHVHRIEKRNMLVLIPANFNGTAETVISMPRLLKTFSGTKAKYVVMVMDCCYAGGVAEELILNIPQEIPTYILASCTSKQKSLSFNELGNGFFTYFFLRYFDTYRGGDFPLKDVVMYCKPLCDAINELLRPGFDHEASMSPQMLWNTYKIKSMSVVETDSVDVVDAKEVDPLAYVRKYQKLHVFSGRRRDDGNSPWERSNVPDMVTAWLHVTAQDSLKYLDKKGVLKKSATEMYATILAFVAQSVAAIACREFKNVNDLPSIFKESTLLDIFLTFAEIMYKTVNYSLLPELKDFRHFMEYYVYKVKTITNTSYESHDIEGFIKLLTMVIVDLRSEEKSRIHGERMHKGEVQADSGHDEVDSGEPPVVLTYLDDLPLATTFVPLPQIETAEDWEEKSDEEDTETEDETSGK